MTATKSSLDKSPIVTPSYIFYSTKRLWAVALLIFIALFFSTSVPLMMSLGNLDYQHLTQDQIRSRIESISYSITVTSVVVSAFAAFFTGSFALSFLHNKVSAGFHHSLPEKRSGHYIASLVSSLTVYVGPAILNTFIIFLAYLTNGRLYGYAVTAIWQLFICSVFYYVVFLAVSFLAGMLSGTSAIHSIMSFYIVLVLPVILISSFLWIELGLSYLRSDPWELTVSVGPAISPIFRLSEVLSALDSETPRIPFGFLLFDTVLSAAIFYIAYRLYKVRPIERAGTPIIYKSVAETIKYSIMFPAALLMGYMFCEFGGFIWLVFGTVAGALLSFMLLNTVLNRTAKAMFSGMKGFGIFAAVSLVLMITFATGIFGYADYHIPAAKEITVTIDGDDYSLTKDEIRQFRKLMQKFNEGLRSGEIDQGVDYVDFDEIYVYENSSSIYTENIDLDLNNMIAKAEGLVRTASFGVNYTNFFGIETRYRYSNFKYSDLADIMSLVANSEARKEKLPNGDGFAIGDIYFSTVFPAEIVEKLGIFEGSFSSDRLGVAGYEIVVNAYSGYNGYEQDDFPESVNRKLFEFIRARLTESTDKQSIGYFHYSFYDYTTNENEYLYGDSGSIALYTEDMATIVDILSNELPNCEVRIEDRRTRQSFYIDKEKCQIIFDELKKLDAEDYVNEMTNNIEYAVVVDAKKSVTKITDKDKLCELLSCASQITADAALSSFAPTDSDYTVMFIYNGGQFDSFAAYFFPDNIPSFLK